VNPDDARTAVLAALARVAPEIDPATVGDDDELQVELELDSMDFLNLVTAVSEATGVDIPERDYPQILTVASFATYLVASTA
jgi:acyl carrier protein